MASSLAYPKKSYLDAFTSELQRKSSGVYLRPNSSAPALGTATGYHSQTPRLSFTWTPFTILANLRIYTGMVILLATLLQQFTAPMYITAFSYASLYKIGWTLRTLTFLAFRMVGPALTTHYDILMLLSSPGSGCLCLATACFGETLLLLCAYFTAYVG